MANKRKLDPGFEDAKKPKRLKPRKEHKQTPLPGGVDLKQSQLPIVYRDFDGQLVFHAQWPAYVAHIRANPRRYGVLETWCPEMRLSWSSDYGHFFSGVVRLDQPSASGIDWTFLSIALKIGANYGPLRIIDDYCRWYELDLYRFLVVLRSFVARERYSPGEANRKPLADLLLDNHNVGTVFRVHFKEAVEDWTTGMLEVRIDFEETIEP